MDWTLRMVGGVARQRYSKIHTDTNTGCHQFQIISSQLLEQANKPIGRQLVDQDTSVWSSPPVRDVSGNRIEWGDESR